MKNLQTALSCILLLQSLGLGAQTLPMAKAETVGLSSSRLGRIDELIGRYIAKKEITGAVTLVARKGRVAHYNAQGLMNVEDQVAMRKDAIFRMASCSKPVTAVAIMMLMEEGKLRLSDPVSTFIPEFRGQSVAVLRSPAPPAPAPNFYTIPVKRGVTIRDLLTHTSGLATGGASAGEVAKLMPLRTANTTLEEFIPKLGALPLDFDPGSQYRYSSLAGMDTLARIVEIASGLTFDEFLKQRLFGPLGMKDTFFSLPPDKEPRLATLYRFAGGALEKNPNPPQLLNQKYFSGAGGLASTAEDFFRFAQMLANGGEFNGKRLLSPRTVELLASNHVGEMFPGQLGRPAGMGFGFGVEVVVDAIKADSRRSNGSFGWDGAYGTHFWVDPKEGIVAVLMIQTANRRLHADFENAVRQAIVE